MKGARNSSSFILGGICSGRQIFFFWVGGWGGNFGRLMMKAGSSQKKIGFRLGQAGSLLGRLQCPKSLPFLREVSPQ